ncbi:MULTISPECIES: NADPH-dependent F420 reductase [Nocardiopsis]|uniref:NADPH-dependent F420 reductase n=1 Tax=Nocardiopsis dassonvillei (strain ATCC 23218 / DSM 43111 / CIP 107115 / JCM 7437 / KCTC 9190 / NBRC 14626 / NCTC 10488 / NRRL B-5397 / IMRU 509) TaxID=446468 RepID=D7B2F8_NOCDD|nr:MULTISPECIES: NADPH-dependent F420 reductase [Nocardiopsis]ADH68615.1 NADPH-dependent F420 reductase [Nocardiopsis dassonvillei subsp. dassonvillei DSM 43111]APC36690.1 NADPH-dependent F420 reductase [Nocardiopsis dassonvillei]NKY78516.1 NADPH-dependent F420 reductase [Nocardiopsis dassonvillei]VEI89124.1 prephenate dehydrogenase [Nocardiopsis dassonvillei]
MTEQSTSAGADIAGLSVAVLGGTGDQGRGLARRLALAGHTVHLGSRSAERADKAARELVEAESTPIDVRGLDNASAAAEGDVVIVAVPWDGHRELLEQLAAPLAGKIVVDCVNPLGFDKKGPFALDVAEGSAAQQAAEVLPDSRVTAAFHHVSAVVLLDPEVEEVDLDVLVLGEDREATDVVRALAERIPGVRGVFGGRLRNAHQVEALTANLIAVNRRYKTHAGIRITGL